MTARGDLSQMRVLSHLVSRRHPAADTLDIKRQISFLQFGKELAGVRETNLAAVVRWFVAFVFKGDEAIIAGIHDGFHKRLHRQVAEAKHRTADKLPVERLQPARPRVFGANVEIFDMYEARMGDRRPCARYRVFVEAKKVTDIERHLEIRAIDGVEQALDALAGVHEEAVVLDAGGDTQTLRMLSNLPAGIDDHRKCRFELRGIRRTQRPRHDIVAQEANVETVAEFDISLYPVDLRASVIADEVPGNAEARKWYSGLG